MFVANKLRDGAREQVAGWQPCAQAWGFVWKLRSFENGPYRWNSTACCASGMRAKSSGRAPMFDSRSLSQEVRVL